MKDLKRCLVLTYFIVAFSLLFEPLEAHAFSMNISNTTYEYDGNYHGLSGSISGADSVTFTYIDEDTLEKTSIVNTAPQFKKLGYHRVEISVKSGTSSFSSSNYVNITSPVKPERYGAMIEYDKMTFYCMDDADDVEGYAVIYSTDENFKKYYTKYVIGKTASQIDVTPDTAYYVQMRPLVRSFRYADQSASEDRYGKYVLGGFSDVLYLSGTNSLDAKGTELTYEEKLQCITDLFMDITETASTNEIPCKLFELSYDEYSIPISQYFESVLWADNYYSCKNPLYYNVTDAWCSSNSYGYIEYVVVSYDANCDKNEVAANREKIMSTLTDIFQNVSTDMSPEEIVLAVHDGIVRELDFAYNDYRAGNGANADLHNAAGVLINRKGLCDGYAYVFQTAMNILGIENRIVMNKSSSINHAWNVVRINGEWYHVDTAWDDLVVSDYKFESAFQNADNHTIYGDTDVNYCDEGYVGHAYLLKTDAEMNAYGYGTGGGWKVYSPKIKDMDNEEVTSAVTSLKGLYNDAKTVMVYNGYWYMPLEFGGKGILKANIKGTGKTEISTDYAVRYLTSDNQYLYYTDGTSIYRCGFDGKNVKAARLNDNSYGRITEFAYKNGKIVYWISNDRYAAAPDSFTWRDADLGSYDLTKCSITYELNGGTSAGANPEYFYKGDTILLNNPVRDGAVFDGWYSDAELKNKIESVPTAQEKPVTIYAKWKDISVDILTYGDIEPLVYDGTKKTPAVSIKDGKKVLVKDKDYELEYSDNTDAGTAKITVTGKGDYTDTKELEFTIEKAVPAFDVTPKNIEMTEGDAPIGIAVKTDSDGAVTYESSDENVVTVDEDGIVTPQVFGNTTIKVTLAEADNYKKAAYTITVVVNERPTYAITYVLNGGTNAKANPARFYIDQEINLADPIRTGAEFDGWYTDAGFKTKIEAVPTAKENPVTIYAKWTNISVSILEYEIPEVTFTGSALEPVPVVKDIDKTLVKDTDYEIIGYYDNVNAGKGSVKINGLGEYTGTTDVEFTIGKKDPDVTAADIEMTYGDSEVLVSIQSESEGAVTYTGDGKVVTVDAAGKITARRASTGEVKIDIAETSNYKSATKTLKVVVHEKVCSTHAPVLQDKVDATCTSEGYEGDLVCSNCGKIVSVGEAVPVIPHSYGEVTAKKAATCGEDGKGYHSCTVCNYGEDVVIPATGNHLYDGGVVVEAATCVLEGKKKYTCKTCGAVKNESIRKNKDVHKNVSVKNAKSPTATEDGYTGDKYCDDCNSVLEKGKIISKTGSGQGTENQVKMPDVGTQIDSAGGKYKVTSNKNGKIEVAFVSANKSDKNITVPSKVTVNGVKYTVTAISDKAFKNCKSLKKVVIPNTVKTIGKNAFSGCKSLKTVTVKSTKITKIGRNAFKGIDKKATIKVPKKQKKKYTTLLRKSGYKGRIK